MSKKFWNSSCCAEHNLCEISAVSEILSSTTVAIGQYVCYQEARGSTSADFLFDLSRNFGKELAMIAGLDYADSDVVIIMDADLQHPPEPFRK